MPSDSPDLPVVVVGAGLAGLACARAVEARGRRALVLEAGDDVGGRVRTDEVDGFRLDRGFQVLLTAYPETTAALDYDALDLRPFFPGALVRRGAGFVRVADPRRRPLDAFGALRSGVARPADAAALLRLLLRARAGGLDDLFARPERSAATLLRDAGVSERLIDAFFRPFLGGITLDAGLGVSSRVVEFVLRMFAAGATAVPARGMGEIPRQLTAGLDVRLGAEVVRVDGDGVRLRGGERVPAAATVVATDGPAAARLLEGLPDPGSAPVTCVYLSAPESPVGGPLLVLDGEGGGPVNNLAVMSDVSEAYAPAGRALVSVSVLGPPDPDDERLLHGVRAHLRGWYGGDVDRWAHLRTYRIDHAQPAQPPGTIDPAQRPLRRSDRVWVCGDHRTDASLNGALAGGRRCGEEVAVALREL